MAAKSNKKWKDSLLKTSLPLEYLVAEKLSELKYGIQGEYHYLRPNEQGIPTEFSVDIWAVNHLFKRNLDLWANLNYLIECKYCHKGIKWLFAPHTKTDTEHIFEISVIHTLDKTCTRLIFNKQPIWNLIKRFPLCFKGVELLPNDATAQNIERGRSQLRYGIPRLAIHLSETQMMIFNDEDLHVEFVCPILVTTADLFVLNKGLSLNEFQTANDINDIAHEVPAIILTNPYSHLFTGYVDKIISDFHKKIPRTKDRLEQIDLQVKKITREDVNPLKSWSALSFDWDIRETSQRILVVNYASLEATLKILKSSVVRSSRSLTQVGYLEKDILKRETWVTDYKDSD
jgi:hypothetical protein